MEWVAVPDNINLARLSPDDVSRKQGLIPIPDTQRVPITLVTNRVNIPTSNLAHFILHKLNPNPRLACEVTGTQTLAGETKRTANWHEAGRHLPLPQVPSGYEALIVFLVAWPWDMR